MSRRVTAVLSASAAAVAMLVAVSNDAGSAPPRRAAALASSPQASVSTRLADRREVSAGTRAYSIGFEDGRFYANGWHITGEMGGVWTPPMKMLDGVWFGVGGQWVGPATKFSSGWGYTRYALPSTDGLTLQRTDFVPDGQRAALFGLTLTNPGAARTTTLTIDAHSELMGQWPWGFDGVTPNAKDNLPDKGRYDGKHLVFTDNGTLPGSSQPHHYSAVVGTSLTPTSGSIGHQYYGPQLGHRCTGKEPGAPADPKPSACDDGPFGNGTGGELTYRISLPAKGSRTVWLAAAGSDQTVASANRTIATVLHAPNKELASKVAARTGIEGMTKLDLPGDRLTQRAIEWGKQNLADLTLNARNLQIRWTDQGKQDPPPLGTLPSATWIGAGYPDYPWIFGTDGEYTAFAAAALGRFKVIEQHLRTLMRVSDLLNHKSGIVAHEIVSDGSVYYGHDSQTTNSSDGSKTNDFNTDETVKFPSAVDLIWRWTGDNSFRDEMYGFTKRNMHRVVNGLDADHDGWPEGSGNVERTGMGPEKVDNAVYLIRGLYDLADLAQSKHDKATYTWATTHANRLRAEFDRTWWHTAAKQYADSLIDPGNHQSFQQYWIGQTPMETELHTGGRSVPGVAPYPHGNAALAGRENNCYSGSAPLDTGLFHTGCTGPPNGAGEKVIYGLTTSIQAVGEGNYGRLGTGQQRRYLHAIGETMFNEPATGGTPDEMPGAMPETFPAPDQGANIDRCWTCRSMFMQAWGNYGTAWSVVHQWLGVDPDIGRHTVAFVPQVPQGQHVVSGSHIRLGHGVAAVTATHYGNRYRTIVTTTRGVGARTVYLGVTLPRGAKASSVLLDGHPARAYNEQLTNRGDELIVKTSSGHHTLVVNRAG
jgi:hypothetical protein